MIVALKGERYDKFIILINSQTEFHLIIEWNINRLEIVPQRIARKKWNRSGKSNTDQVLLPTSKDSTLSRFLEHGDCLQLQESGPSAGVL